jgi:hypothetical protein
MGWELPFELPVKKQPSDKRKADQQRSIDKQMWRQVGIKTRGEKNSLGNEGGHQADKDREHPRRKERPRNFKTGIAGTARKQGKKNNA